MSENSFVTNLRDKFRAVYGSSGDWQRLEDKLSLGIPDINAIANGQEWWLEAKYLDSLPQRRIDVGLRPEQKIWLQRGHKVGRRTALIVHIKGSGYYFIPPMSVWCKSIDVSYFLQMDMRKFKTAEELVVFIFTDAAGVPWNDNRLGLMR